MIQLEFLVLARKMKYVHLNFGAKLIQHNFSILARKLKVSKILLSKKYSMLFGAKVKGKLT